MLTSPAATENNPVSAGVRMRERIITGPSCIASPIYFPPNENSSDRRTDVNTVGSGELLNQDNNAWIVRLHALMRYPRILGAAPVGPPPRHETPSGRAGKMPNPLIRCHPPPAAPPRPNAWLDGRSRQD